MDERKDGTRSAEPRSRQPGPKQPKRRRDPDAKREALHAAAMRCFAAHGFEAVSIADIAGEAGIAVGTVYRFYANKIALLRAMHDVLEGEFVTCLERAWTTDAPYAARLEALCAALFALMDQRQAELRVLSMTTDVAHEDGRLPGDRLRAQIALNIAEAQAAGEFRTGDPAMLAALAHGAVEGAMRHWLRGAADRDATVRATAAMLRHAMVR